jgi:Mn2+/Fe2+ NRAMP family transporter
MKTFRNYFLRFIPLLAVIGPGIISGSVDNDAGGITTYSVAGAHFGFGLLWVLFLTTISLAITQEIGVRMGLATGKGLASLIREKFGIRWTTGIILVLLIANIGTIAA